MHDEGSSYWLPYFCHLPWTWSSRLSSRKGFEFPSSVNVYIPHSFYFESYKVYSGHTHTRPQLRKQILIIDSI